MSLQNILNKLTKSIGLQKFFDNVVGIYFDGTKLYCVNLKLVDTSTQQWQVTDTATILLIDKINENSNIHEMIAQKTAKLCNERNWQTKIIALCLNINDVVIDYEDLSILPKDKVGNAVKYQISAAGDFEIDKFFYAYMEFDSEMWMEGILKSKAAKWIDEFSKHDLNILCLTAMPDSIKQVEGIDLTYVSENFINSDGLKSIFAAKVLAKREMPNLLIEKTVNLVGWDFNRVAALIVVLTLLVSSIVLSLDAWQFFTVKSELTNEQQKIKLLETDQRKGEFIAKALKEVDNKNQILVNLSKISFPCRSLLIHFGTIKIKGVWLTEVNNIDDKTIEIQCEAVDFETMSKYIKKLETDNIFKKTKIKMKYSELQRDSGKIKFIIDLPIIY